MSGDGDACDADDLPVVACLDDLDACLQRSQVVIFEGATGSGKSTAVPQFIGRRGYTARGSIACTQPRRIAASSLSRWVADLQGSELGQVPPWPC